MFNKKEKEKLYISLSENGWNVGGAFTAEEWQRFGFDRTKKTFYEFDVTRLQEVDMRLIVEHK